MLTLRPLEPRFQGHQYLQCQWHHLRNKEIESVSEVETHALETRGKNIEAIGRASGYPKVVWIWSYSTF